MLYDIFQEIGHWMMGGGWMMTLPPILLISLVIFIATRPIPSEHPQPDPSPPREDL